ncbi:hypothetical protein ACHQM5_005801 [Ranunculus cassubicifolius]
MARPSWLVDGVRIAKKIKSASEKCDDPKKVNWKSNPSRTCPECSHVIDNSDVTQEWPGLPCGVKFDPTDQEIIWHLLAKAGTGNIKPHPFIDEFIPTVNEDDGICYTHPQCLPGVRQDGSVSHFFHRAIKAYNTGTRKRRKIHGDDLGDVRWHKTGRTKPVILDGIQMGCKKIMVLYMCTQNSKKPEKTSWVMHQYHLGTAEDEQDGEFVISKVFCQQPAKPGDKVEQDPSSEVIGASITKVDPVTPKSVIPEPPRSERWQSDVDLGLEHESAVCATSVQQPVTRNSDNVAVGGELVIFNDDTTDPEDPMINDHVEIMEDQKFLAGESQFQFDSQQFELLNSQQLIEGLSLGDELLRSQSQPEEEDDENQSRSLLSDYSRLGVEAFKKDIEECQKLTSLDLPTSSSRRRMLKPRGNEYLLSSEDQKQGMEEFENTSQFDSSNIVMDTPPDFRLSQLGVETFKKDIEQCQKLSSHDFPTSSRRGMPKSCGNEHLSISEDQKQDMEEFQNASQFDPSNIIMDTPPEFRLSQLEFNSEESFGWAGKFSQ